MVPDLFFSLRAVADFHHEACLSSAPDRLPSMERKNLKYCPCSGSMIPDTNVGGKIATINEVSDDQKATFFFS